MLSDDIQVLKESVIFKNIEEEKLNYIYSKISGSIKKYKKGETISHESDNCNELSVILDGKTELQTIFPSGKVFTLAQLSQGDGFGEAVLFSSTHKYPISVIALSNARIIEISKDKLMEVFTECPVLLENFLALLSNRLIMLNKKLKLLSIDSIRGKLCHMLLEKYKVQQTNMIKLSASKKSLAEQLGVQRPSLSRELIKMKNEGLIDYDKDIVKILDIDMLEDELFK